MSDKPNILLIMTDQQRADFSAAEGYPLDPTPTIDAIGRAGARFRNAYTPMPTCSPARTSLLTGRYPSATRVRENSATAHAVATTSLPETLSAHGYRTILAGKNHSHLPDSAFDWASTYMHTGGGRPDRRTEEDAAFDAWLKSLDHRVELKPTPFPLERQQPYRIVSDAIASLTCHPERRSHFPGRGGVRGGEEEPRRDTHGAGTSPAALPEGLQPWFMWLSFPEPHNPYQCPEPYHSMFAEDNIPDRLAGPEDLSAMGPTFRWLRTLIEEKRPGYDDHWRAYRRVYLGMLRMIDDQIARFLDHLEQTGQRDSTLIIFCSDHGDYAGEYGLQRKGAGLPECLVRVPLAISGPGIAPLTGKAAGLVPAPECTTHLRDEFVSLVDLFPTITDMLGIPLPDGVQGRSLWTLLSGCHPERSEGPRREEPANPFRSVHAQLGVGGIGYDETVRPPLHFPYEGPTFDELNSVTQGGDSRMVRMGDWKLIIDVRGAGQLYHLPSDPAELRNRYDDPACATERAALTTELALWMIRTEDDLPLANYSRQRHPRNWPVNPSPGAEPREKKTP